MHTVPGICHEGCVARLEVPRAHVSHAPHPLHLWSQAIPHGEHIEAILVLVDEEGAIAVVQLKRTDTLEHRTLKYVIVLQGVVVLSRSNNCYVLLMTISNQ